MNRNDRKRAFIHASPAKIQTRLRVCAVWSESSPGAFWTAKDTRSLHAENEDYDQTARVRRLIWVFVGHTCQKIRFLTLRFVYYEICVGDENEYCLFIWTSALRLSNLLCLIYRKPWIDLDTVSYFFHLFPAFRHLDLPLATTQKTVSSNMKKLRICEVC